MSLAAALPLTLPVLKLKFLILSALFLVVLVQAVDEQARRNVHRRCADLEQLAILTIVLERRAAATNHRNVAAGRAAILDARRAAAFVGQLRLASRCRELHTVPVGSIFQSDIPHVVFAVRRRHAEPGKGRAVIAERVLRIAVAVRTETTTGGVAGQHPAPGEIAGEVVGVLGALRADEHAGAVEHHRVRLQ